MSFIPFGHIAGAMLAHSRNMQVISENLNHINTPGAKKTNLEFQETLSERPPAEGKPIPSYPTAWYSSPEAPRRQEIEKQGAISQSRRNFDLAINGQGFFITKSRVNDDLGNPGGISLTRNGQIDRLVVKEGGQETTYLTLGPDQDLLLGWLADDNGNFNNVRSVNSLSTLTIEQLSRDYAFKRSSQMDLQVNVDANSAEGTSVPFSFDIIDSQGELQQLNIEFIKEAGLNSWTAKITAPGYQNFETEIDVNFDATGKLVDPQTFELDLTDSSGANVPLLVNLRDSSSYGASSAVFYTRDNGIVRGELNSLSVTENGDIEGLYTNGASRKLARVAIGDVRSVENMIPQSAHKWRPTAKSGEIEVLDASDTDRLDIISNALEASNIDIADSFAEMILTQRIYGSLTQVLRAADEMTKTAIESKL